MTKSPDTSKNESLKTNKANVLACQIGVLPYHQKASIFQRIILLAIVVIGSIVLLVVTWSTLNLVGFIIFIPIVIFCVYKIRQYFNSLRKPEIGHIEGRVSQLINPYRVKCQGTELVASKETWLEVEAGESYRLWYSLIDKTKYLAAFELLQTRPIREDTFSGTGKGLVWSNSLGGYTNATKGLPYSPFDEKNYIPLYEQFAPLANKEAEAITFGSLEALVDALSSDNSTERLYTYRALLTLGGEAVNSLKAIAIDTTSIQQPVALWLLDKIAYETNDRLGENVSHLLCTRCLVHCHSHDVRLSWRKSIVYYGCRNCNQSRDFLNVDKIIAVLDSNMVDEYDQQDRILWGNWLRYRTLFDFDEVQIIQATDEEVERFVVQVGNDTDRIRRSRHQDLHCSASANCELSENTIRILEKTFGQLEITHLSELPYKNNDQKSPKTTIDKANWRPNTQSSLKWLFGLGSLVLALTWWVKRKI